MSDTPRTDAAAIEVIEMLEACTCSGDLNAAVKLMTTKFIGLGKELERDLNLMTAGREQDQRELKLCVEALKKIGAPESTIESESYYIARNTLRKIGAIE